VQVETVGELGVILVLFVVGLDLSPDNLRKVNNYDIIDNYIGAVCMHILVRIVVLLV